MFGFSNVTDWLAKPKNAWFLSLSCCVQVIDIDDQGRCLAINGAGKQMMTVWIPDNALGREI